MLLRLWLTFDIQQYFFLFNDEKAPTAAPTKSPVTSPPTDVSINDVHFRTTKAAAMVLSIFFAHHEFSKFCHLSSLEQAPTHAPTLVPTLPPTLAPTLAPTLLPTQLPTLPPFPTTIVSLHSHVDWRCVFRY